MEKNIACKIFCVIFLLSFACGRTQKDSISVVTFNMYIGFDAETKIGEIVSGGDVSTIASEVVETFLGNDPDERISLVAQEIALLKPDFIGLQEVTDLALLPYYSIDYLDLLLEELSERGGPEYNVLSVDNLSLEMNVGLEDSAPLFINYKDREVLLYKKGFELIGDAVSQRLTAYREPVDYEGEEVIFYRGVVGGRFGWAGENVATIFTTHLDQKYLGDVQANQMIEILQIAEPYKGDPTLILVGDFNTEEGEDTYGLIVDDGYVDTYRLVNPESPGFTCCNETDLSNTEPMAYQKIDLIFNLSSNWNPQASEIILNTRNSIWPSDHFGVMTEFKRLVDDDQ